MNDIACTVAALHVHPVKSCAGIATDEALVAETGLDLDRQWMIVDAQGEMFTQRDVPRMALIATKFQHGALVLRAPGMLALHLSLDTVEEATRVRVWNDQVKAFSMGALAAQWVSDFLGQAARIVRFDPDQRRLSSAQWTGTDEAENGFADGYPLLVANSASLADLNARLAAKGVPAVSMQRFRPNLVLDGLQAFDEDHIDIITIAADGDADGGDVVLRLVKPCIRCNVPNIDPASAIEGTEPGATLATYRADARVDGGITFGMNAIVMQGIGRTLRVGQSASASWHFDRA